ncbi:MAG: dihydrolipoyl dehydrogenase [Saprospiraceae bacterium]|nr:dihydrolipoyl dehydrogenase [Saprospiraceae bacterium]
MKKVLIIGSGPGGYVCAIRCAQLGMDVTLVEKYASLGGTCLNEGCIPSKALLDSSEHYHYAKHQMEVHGIQVSEVKLDFAKMMDRKKSVVEQNTKGIEFLMKKNKIHVKHGFGSFVNGHTVSVKTEAGSEELIQFDYCVIATGSKPFIPQAFGFDGHRVISSTEALCLEKVPGHLAIVGAGVIGLELGSVFARLGSKVSMIEFQGQILPGMDTDAAKELQKILQGLGITFYLQSEVKSILTQGEQVELSFTVKGKEDAVQDIRADYALIAIGRRAYTDGLQLENIGLKLDAKGKIPVQDNCSTSIPHIYAIGDVIDGPMLAHKAEEEAVFVAETIAGQKPVLHSHLIPGVVYTWPEFASIGYTENQLKDQGRQYRIGKYPFKALGRARASMDTDGFVKVLSDATGDEVLGVHILGPRAADLIMEAVAIMNFKGAAEDIARICHPHPTYSEAIKEAALEACGLGAIHK